jgi:hypothetical protein
MRTYEVTLTGKTPLLMHYDNVEWADFMAEWAAVPENKKMSKPGDDRTPAWRWLGTVYHDGTHLCVPAANIMRSLLEGGAMVPVPGGKHGKTFKAQTQSGMMSVEPFWPLLINNKPIPWAALEALKESKKFPDHKKLAESLGFELLVKRAKIGSSKHVRVRPQFPVGWQLCGRLSVWDEQIEGTVLSDILAYAGQYKGLCDWRPGGRTPGPYGTFEAGITEG